MKDTPNNDLSRGNLVPLLMYSSFEDYFGCENNLERIELLIKTILKKEGVESVKVLRKLVQDITKMMIRLELLMLSVHVMVKISMWK